MNLTLEKVDACDEELQPEPHARIGWDVVCKGFGVLAKGGGVGQRVLDQHRPYTGEPGQYLRRINRLRPLQFTRSAEAA